MDNLKSYFFWINSDINKEFNDALTRNNIQYELLTNEFRYGNMYYTYSIDASKKEINLLELSFSNLLFLEKNSYQSVFHNSVLN